MSDINKFTSDTTQGANTGFKNQVSDNQSIIYQLAITSVNFAFDTVAEALTKANWLTGVKDVQSNRIYPTPYADDIADKTKDPTFFTSKIMGDIMVTEGTIAFQLIMGQQNEKVYSKLRSFNNKPIRFFGIDKNKNIIGTSPDGEKIEGFEGTIYVTPRKISDGTKPSQFMIECTLKDLTEWTDRKAILQPYKEDASWSFNEIDGVYDVNLKASSVLATGCTVAVNIDSFKESDSNGQVVGLVKADFVLKSAIGAAKTITTLTDKGDGTYTLVATLATGDTLNLVACSAISITDYAVESTGAITMPTIS